jgi:hypothetical protein
MKKPIMRIGSGTGRAGWLSVELDSLRFVLEPENGEGTVETLTLAELKDRFPISLGLVTGVLAQAVKSNQA